MFKKLIAVSLCSLVITGCAVSAPTQTKGDTHYVSMDLVQNAKQNKTDPALSDISEILTLDTERFNAKLDRIDIGETTVKTNYLKAGELDRIIVTLHDYKDSKAVFDESFEKTGISTQTHGEVSYYIEEPDNVRRVTLFMHDRFISMVLEKNSPLEDIPHLIDALKFVPLS